MSEIIRYISRWAPVGSRVTCNPPPQDTDEDFLVLVDEEDFDDLTCCLEESNWELGGSEILPAEHDSNVEIYGFNSWKKKSPMGHDVNFIITCSEEFFDKFVEASNICKALNLLDKNARIAVFQRILYNNENWVPYEDVEMEF